MVMALFFSLQHESTASFAFRGAFTPEESQVGQGVDEFLIGHGGVREHASARMSFPDCTRALLVGGQTQYIRTKSKGSDPFTFD